MVDRLKIKEYLWARKIFLIFKKGAYTGDISIDMIEELGCKWTIIGHSEEDNFTMKLMKLL